MLGGISEIISTFLPGLSFKTSLWMLTIITMVLLVIGHYSLIERFAVSMVITFTLLTVACAFLLSQNPQYFSWESVIDGLKFTPPQGGLITAVTVFGATGVGAIELIAYPYWCIEKGYAKFAGKRENTLDWTKRAEGWIKIMGVDVLLSWFIYTFATIAFYFLGAGILSNLGLLPQGLDMVGTLSNMFTETLGNWSHYLFLTGSLAVLYSTVFSGIAGLSRMLADFTGMIGLYDKSHYRTRLKVMRISSMLLPIIPTLLFLYYQEPVFMVKVSGVSQALLLPIVGLAPLYLRYFHLPKEISPKTWITVALWASTLTMLILMGYAVFYELS